MKPPRTIPLLTWFAALASIGMFLSILLAILDVRQQVLIGSNPESWRSIFPFDLKCATGVNIGESADRSFFSFDVSIAAHARQMATDKQSDIFDEQNNLDLFHVTLFFLL